MNVLNNSVPILTSITQNKQDGGRDLRLQIQETLEGNNYKHRDELCLLQ